MPPEERNEYETYQSSWLGKTRFLTCSSFLRNPCEFYVYVTLANPWELFTIKRLSSSWYRSMNGILQRDEIRQLRCMAHNYWWIGYCCPTVSTLWCVCNTFLERFFRAHTIFLLAQSRIFDYSIYIWSIVFPILWSSLGRHSERLINQILWEFNL